MRRPVKLQGRQLVGFQAECDQGAESVYAPDSAVLCVIAPFRVVPGLTPTLGSVQKETPFPLTHSEPWFPADYNTSGQVPTAKPIAAARGYAMPSLAYA